MASPERENVEKLLKQSDLAPISNSLQDKAWAALQHTRREAGTKDPSWPVWLPWLASAAALFLVIWFSFLAPTFTANREKDHSLARPNNVKKDETLSYHKWRKGETLEAHSLQVTGLEFSKDGEKLASCGWDGKVFVWETETWEEKNKLFLDFNKNQLCQLYDVRFWDNGNKISASYLLSKYSWDLKTSELDPDVEEFSVNHLAMDLKTAVASINNARMECRELRVKDRKLRLIRVSSTDPLFEAKEFEIEMGDLDFLRFTPDGGKLIIAGVRERETHSINPLTLLVYDTKTWEKSDKIHGDEIGAMLVTPDSKTLILATARNEIIGWDLEKMEKIFTLKEGHKNLEAGGEDNKARLQALTLSPDGKYLVSGSVDGTVQIWENVSLTKERKVGYVAPNPKKEGDLMFRLRQVDGISRIEIAEAPFSKWKKLDLKDDKGRDCQPIQCFKTAANEILLIAFYREKTKPEGNTDFFRFRWNEKKAEWQEAVSIISLNPKFDFYGAEQNQNILSMDFSGPDPKTGGTSSYYMVSSDDGKSWKKEEQLNISQPEKKLIESDLFRNYKERAITAASKINPDNKCEDIDLFLHPDNDAIAYVWVFLDLMELPGADEKSIRPLLLHTQDGGKTFDCVSEKLRKDNNFHNFWPVTHNGNAPFFNGDKETYCVFGAELSRKDGTRDEYISFDSGKTWQNKDKGGATYFMPKAKAWRVGLTIRKP